jgi:hypothetical protein
MVSIESTSAGREGYFYEFTMEAQRAKEERRVLSMLDFQIHFFPWYRDPSYSLDGDIVITKEMSDYFSLLESKHQIKLTEGQKKWYVKKAKLNRDKMFAEYPSTLEEAFSVSVEGAYYQKDMNRVYLENRIGFVPHTKGVDVHTFWDLGWNDFNVILFVQFVGNKINFVDMYYNHHESLSHYLDVLKQKREEYGFRYGKHFLPHDVEVTNIATGSSRRQTLQDLGLNNIFVGTKTDILFGIDKVRSMFNRFFFDEQKCQKLHECLFNYRKDFDAKMGVWKDSPRHDENSHFADAVRLMACEWKDFYAIDFDVEVNKEDMYQSFF